MTVKTDILELAEGGVYDGLVTVKRIGSELVFEDPLGGAFTLSQLLANVPSHPIGSHSGMSGDFATQYFNLVRLVAWLADGTNTGAMAIPADVAGHTTFLAHLTDRAIHQQSAQYVYEVGVGKAYTTWAAAIAASNAAGSGVDKLIVVWPGTYNETVDITVSRTHIIALKPEATILQHDSTGQTITAGGTGTGEFALRILASNCSVEGLKFSNPCTSATNATALSIGSTSTAVTGIIVRRCVLSAGTTGSLRGRAAIVWNSGSSVEFQDCVSEASLETPFCQGATTARRCRWQVTATDQIAVKVSGCTVKMYDCAFEGTATGYCVETLNATVVLQNCVSVNNQKLYTVQSAQTASTIKLGGSTAMDGGFIVTGGGSVVVTSDTTAVPRNVELLPGGSATATVPTLDSPDLVSAIKYWAGGAGDNLLEMTERFVMMSYDSGTPADSQMARVFTIVGTEVLRLIAQAGQVTTQMPGNAEITGNATVGGDLGVSGVLSGTDAAFSGAVDAASFNGLGSGLTNLPASQLSGTVPLANLSGITNAQLAAGAAIVDTKLATISTAGKVSDSALSSNIPRKNAANTFSATQTISSGDLEVTSGSINAPSAIVTCDVINNGGSATVGGDLTAGALFTGSGGITINGGTPVIMHFTATDTQTLQDFGPSGLVTQNQDLAFSVPGVANGDSVVATPTSLNYGGDISWHVVIVTTDVVYIRFTSPTMVDNGGSDWGGQSFRFDVWKH